jgi:hypothetical protein
MSDVGRLREHNAEGKPIGRTDPGIRGVVVIRIRIIRAAAVLALALLFLLRCAA